MKKILCTFLAFLLLASLAACGKTEAETSGENPENSILRIGAANDWTSEGMNLVFDTLTYRINSTEASKQLIEVIPNEDYTEYTLKVTEGIEFSDGTKLDAECVKYSIENEALADTLGFHTLMSSLEIKDDSTLIATFPSSYATFEYELSYILAVKVGAVSPEGNITEYIGTGMYVLDDFTPGSSCTFTYNEKYWNAANKKPSVTTVEWKVIPDLPTRVMTLENKEIDVIGISEHGGINDYATLNQLRDVEGINIDMKADGKTAKSINISCGARLAPFDIQELREITMYDELELDTLGDRKTALFLIMSDTDSTFNFLISMIYSQLFNLLCEKADDVYGGRLPVHVRCLIDECANIGQIPNLEKLMATIRSREISACLVLQAQSQLKALYKDNADTIIGNCDSSIFLGGKEPGTLKELNQALGKETIDTFNTGESRGREVSHSLNYQKLGKDLATIDELAVLDGGKCILQLRGVRPFLSDKYDITRHPNYKYLSDANPRNAFDIEKYLSTRLVPKADEVYEVFDAGRV